MTEKPPTVLISEAEIQTKVAELAARISPTTTRRSTISC